MTQDALLRAAKTLQALPHYGVLKSLQRLGGLTNEVFRAETDRGVFCLRLPGKGTQDYINRAHEAQAARETARVGVSAPVIHFDAATGLSLTGFLEGAVTMTPRLFAERAGAPARAGQALRRLHGSDAVFASRFEPFAMIDSYVRVLEAKHADFPDGFRETMQAASAIRAALAAQPLPLAPCHCDPLSENFLDTGERMWIVDWEYSGMNDPLWDIGDFCVEAELTVLGEADLLAAYFAAAPTPAERGRILVYKAMCDLFWALWGLIQHANNNPVDDFRAYGLNRLARCGALMASAGFAQAVGNIAVAGR